MDERRDITEALEREKQIEDDFALLRYKLNRPPASQAAAQALDRIEAEVERLRTTLTDNYPLGAYDMGGPEQSPDFDADRKQQAIAERRAIREAERLSKAQAVAEEEAST